MKLSAHFDSSEFVCPCGCGYDKIDQSHIDLLEDARKWAGIPFHINSGCRCFAHNAQIGGVDSSAHVNGFASDIRVSGSKERYKILTALIDSGFNRIGVAETFIHADNDPVKPSEVTWVY